MFRAFGALVALLVASAIAFAGSAQAQVITDGGVLTPGVPVVATFAAQSDWVQYRITVPAGKRLALTSSDSATPTLAAAYWALHGDPTLTPLSQGLNSQAGNTSVATLDAAPADRDIDLTLSAVFGAGTIPFVAGFIVDPPVQQVAVGGSATGAITAVGQQLRFTFPGVAGHRLGIRDTSGMSVASWWYSATLQAGSGPEVTLNLMGPDYTAFVPVTMTGDIYTLTIRGNPGQVGSVSLQLVDIPDVAGNLTLDQVTTVSLDSIWSRALFQYQGVAGAKTRLMVLSANVHHSDGSPGVVYVNSSEAIGIQVGANPGSPGSALPASTVAYSASYGSPGTVSVYGDGGTTGTVTFKIGPVKSTASPLSVGTSRTAMIADPQDKAWFDMVPPPVGQRWTVNITGASFHSGTAASSPWSTVNLSMVEGQPHVCCGGYTYDGPSAGSISLSQGQTSGSFTAVSTPSGVASGWRLVIDPTEDMVGTLTVVVKPADDIAVPLTVGTAVTGTTRRAGQNLAFTFPGSPDSSASVLTLNEVTLTGIGGVAPQPPDLMIEQDGQRRVPLITYGAPTGNAVPFSWSINDQPNGQQVDLTRPWQLYATMSPATIGSMKVTLVRPTAATSVLRSGETETARFAGIGDSRRFTFTGTAGQRLVVERDKATTASTLTLSNATGTVLGSDGDSARSSLNVTQSGPLVLTVASTVPGVGSVDVRPWLVTDPVVPMQGSKTITWATYQNPRLTFTAAAGERVILDVSAASFVGAGPVSASMLTPEGYTFPMSVITSGGATFAESQVLNVSAGTYTIVLDTGVRTHGSITASVRHATDVSLTGANNKPTTVTLAQAGANARIAMPATTSATLSYKVSGSTFTAATLRFVDDTYGSEWASVAIPLGASSGVVAANPYGGSYHVVVDPTGPATGAVKVTIKPQ